MIGAAPCASRRHKCRAPCDRSSCVSVGRAMTQVIHLQPQPLSSGRIHGTTSRQRATIRCSGRETSKLYQSSFEDVKNFCVCQVLTAWDSVVTTFAPERLVFENSLGVKSKWFIPWLQTLDWNYLTFTLRDMVLEYAYNPQDCGFVAVMLFTFVKMISMVDGGPATWNYGKRRSDDFMQGLVEITDEEAPVVEMSTEVTNYVGELLETKVLRTSTLCIFGVLQWLSIAQRLALRGDVTWQKKPSLCRPSNATLLSWRSILGELAGCLLRRAPAGIHTKPLGWILFSGQRFWGPLHIAMAEEAKQTAFQLSLPELESDAAPSTGPLVELCATAWHRQRLREWVRNPRGDVPRWHGISSAQPDGAIFTVVTAAGLSNAWRTTHGSSKPFLLEFLVYAERPHGESHHNRSLYTCGPHAAVLPEASCAAVATVFCFPQYQPSLAGCTMYHHSSRGGAAYAWVVPGEVTPPQVSLRKWRCALGDAPAMEATAVSVFRQAATLRCPVPHGVSLRRRLRVRLQSEVHGRYSKWQTELDLCPVPSLPSVPSVPSNPSHHERSILRSRKGLNASAASLSLAVCTAPAWDMRDLERSVPGLTRTFLQYYTLFGASDITFYDYDGTFARHSDFQDFLAAGNLRYFPYFAHGVSKLLGEFWNSGALVGSTGSKSGFMQELSLSHCILNYRGLADLVLISSMDAFLVVGSAVAFPTCWDRPELTKACCSAPSNSSMDARCWRKSRSFSKCCLEPKHHPQHPQRLNPWQQFLQSRSKNFWRIQRLLGTIELRVCEFTMPFVLSAPKVSHREPLWLLSSHLWRPEECRGLPQNLVNPWRFLSQSAEWIKLQPGSSRYFAKESELRVAHLVNLHKVRCTDKENTYGNGRLPCRMADFGLRWAISGMTNWNRSNELQPPVLRRSSSALETACATRERCHRPRIQFEGYPDLYLADQSSTQQACVTKVPGEVVEFREFAGQLGILHSTLARLSDDETQPGETLRCSGRSCSCRVEVHSCVDGLVKLELEKPRRCLRLSVDSARDQLQLPVAAAEVGEGCDQWLQGARGISATGDGKHHAGLLQHARRALGSKNLRRLNDSTVDARLQVVSADLDASQRNSANGGVGLRGDAITQGFQCIPDVFHDGIRMLDFVKLQVHVRLGVQLQDSCAPLFGLQLGRMDFLSVLRSRWPTFLQLQLLSERMHAAWQSRWQLCDLDNSQLPRDFAHLTRDFVDKEGHPGRAAAAVDDWAIARAAESMGHAEQHAAAMVVRPEVMKTSVVHSADGHEWFTTGHRLGPEPVMHTAPAIDTELSIEADWPWLSHRAGCKATQVAMKTDEDGGSSRGRVWCSVSAM
eukprot:Skav210134  [mRNA]  locus=scaffold1493:6032:27841:+ [translate_table: standard]